MGIKTTLAGITLTAGDKTAANAAGIDVVDMMNLAQLKCQELTNLLNVIINDVMTPASDSTNITTLNTQITNLS
jgi:hypothetical protein